MRLAAGEGSRKDLASMRPRLWRPRNRVGGVAVDLVPLCFNEAEALETSESRGYSAIDAVPASFNEAEALETSECYVK